MFLEIIFMFFICFSIFCLWCFPASSLGSLIVSLILLHHVLVGVVLLYHVLIHGMVFGRCLQFVWRWIVELWYRYDMKWVLFPENILWSIFSPPCPTPVQSPHGPPGPFLDLYSSSASASPSSGGFGAGAGFYVFIFAFFVFIFLKNIVIIIVVVAIIIISLSILSSNSSVPTIIVISSSVNSCSWTISGTTLVASCSFGTSPRASNCWFLKIIIYHRHARCILYHLPFIILKWRFRNLMMLCFGLRCIWRFRCIGVGHMVVVENINGSKCVATLTV